MCGNARVHTRLPLGYAGAALALVLVGGCGEVVVREYSWTRQQPAVFRKSRTEFTVRFTLDRERNQVVWFEDARDAEGEIGRNVKTFDNCAILDAENWECEPFALGADVVEQVHMRDGKLFQEYWGEHRAFRVRHRVFGLRF